MPTITFRFTTECELTFEGDSYEESYLRFKDVCQQQTPIINKPFVKIYPPENGQILFEVDEQNTFSDMGMMKGNFKQDILANLPQNWVTRIESHARLRM